MPALLTRISTAPKRASASRMSAIHCSGSAMSAGWKKTSPAPFELRCSASNCASDGVAMPLITRTQPAAANVSAMPRPIPDVEPVTTATQPSGSAAPILKLLDIAHSPLVLDQPFNTIATIIARLALNLLKGGTKGSIGDSDQSNLGMIHLKNQQNRAAHSQSCHTHSSQNSRVARRKNPEAQE